MFDFLLKITNSETKSDNNEIQPLFLLLMNL